MKFPSPTKKESLIIILIALIFILSSYVVQSNGPLIENYLKNKPLALPIYLLITILAIVLAPITIIPLMPIATMLWGPFYAGFISLIGLSIGSIIAFIIARKYGKPLLIKFLDIGKMQRIENYLPKENVFWTIVLLRITIPADILSYALGLFSKISLARYTLATLIGIIPFAFIYSYIGAIPAFYQIITLTISLIIILAGIKSKTTNQRINKFLGIIM